MSDFRGYTPRPNGAGSGPLWFVRRAVILCLANLVKPAFPLVLGLILIEVAADLILLVYEKYYMPRARVAGQNNILEVRLTNRAWAIWVFDSDYGRRNEMAVKLQVATSGRDSLYPNLQVNGGVVMFLPHKARWIVRHESANRDLIYSVLLEDSELRTLLRCCANLLQ